METKSQKEKPVIGPTVGPHNIAASHMAHFQIWPAHDSFHLPSKGSSYFLLPTLHLEFVSTSTLITITILHGSTTVTTTMQQCVDDLVDDIDNLHLEYASTGVTDMIITAETNHSTSLNSRTAIRTTSSHITSTTKPHAPPRDPCWDAIQFKKSNGTGLSLDNLGLLRRLGSGDIGSVYLVELEGSDGCMFAAKVMDKEDLAVRNKGNRARIEREILEMLDHPFLPTLYAWLESDKWTCLLTEFCPGGDLHVLRQCQPDKRFREASVR